MFEHLFVPLIFVIAVGVPASILYLIKLAKGKNGAPNKETNVR
jgi:hypothetical protein